MSVARGVGLDLELLEADETLRRHPFLAGDDILASLWDPLDGEIDPTQLCQALARRLKRLLQSDRQLFERVTALSQDLRKM